MDAVAKIATAEVQVKNPYPQFGLFDLNLVRINRLPIKAIKTGDLQLLPISKT